LRHVAGTEREVAIVTNRIIAEEGLVKKFLE
jgi:hypothetical protein